MEALEMEADAEVRSSLLHNNNNNTRGLPLLIHSSKQQYKTSAYFISIFEIRGFL